MKAKTEQTLLLVAILIALFVPIKVTAVIVVLILLWCFRDSIAVAALAIPELISKAVAFFRPKRKSAPKHPSPQIIEEEEIGP